MCSITQNDDFRVAKNDSGGHQINCGSQMDADFVCTVIANRRHRIINGKVKGQTKHYDEGFQVSVLIQLVQDLSFPEVGITYTVIFDETEGKVSFIEA